MTLTLTAAGWAFAVQVTDRLLTAGCRTFDPYSNKNVVYLARDGIAALAFSGPAFIRGMPTDQWMVQVLTGETFEAAEPVPTFWGAPTKKHCLGLGHALRILGDAFNEEAKGDHLLRDGHFEILAVGYQGVGRSLRPVTLFFSKEASQNVGIYGSGQRWLRWPTGFELALSPSPNRSLVDVESLRLMARACETSSDMARLLSRTIRDAGSAFVGRDCLLIEIDTPRVVKPQVRVSFVMGSAALSNPIGKAPTPAQAQVADRPWYVRCTLIALS